MAAGGKKEEDAAFKEYVSLMLDKKKFRPDEKSECRWHAESEDGSGEYITTASGKSVFCACKGLRASTGKERRHIRLIRMISGLLGFAATREAAVGEITGARCPPCKKASYREYCKRPTARKGDTRRYLCNACGRKFLEGPEFGPAWYSPEMIMQPLSMHCRGMSTRNISDHWREARQSADEKCPSRAIISLWAKRYLTVIAGYVAQFTPDASDIWSTDEMYVMVKKAMRRLYAFMDHGTRWLLGAKIADTKNTADITPLAQEARESAGKMPEVALGDGGANLNLAISIAHAEEGASGKRETRQAYAHLTGNPTGLRQERASRTLGERLWIPGFVKGTNSKLAAGFVALYDCIRRHLGLGGDTPAKAAGIITKGANPWATLIKNAY